MAKKPKQEPMTITDWLWYNPPEKKYTWDEDECQRSQFCDHCLVRWMNIGTLHNMPKPRCFNCGRWVSRKW